MHAPGTFHNPVELRPGAIEYFYIAWSRWLGAVDSGDYIITSTWSCDEGATLDNEAINTGGALNLGGVSYAVNTVTYVRCQDVEAGNLVELVNTVTTQGGRTEKQSLFVRGVKNYS